MGEVRVKVKLTNAIKEIENLSHILGKNDNVAKSN